MMSTETSSKAGVGPQRMHASAVSLRVHAILLALVLASAGPASGVDLESVVLDIRHRRAQELHAVAAPLLSPAGRISVDQRTNTLIVVDTRAAIARVTEMVHRLDRPPVPLRIDIRFGRSRTAERREAAAEGSISGGGGEVSTGPEAPEGIHVRVRDRIDADTGQADLSVATLSGSPAHVSLGTEVPYRQRGKTVCRRYGGCPGSASFHRVQTGFWITPLLSGDRIDLELVPEIEDLETGQQVRFAAASTHVVVLPGQWVDIGSGKDADTRALAEILGTSDARREESFSILLRVERIDGQ